MDFLIHMAGIMVLSGLPPFSFTVYSNFIVKIRKRLREFEKNINLKAKL
jgi:hypothetical protein